MNGFSTTHFRRICLGNLLMFISQYMLIPMLPIVMAENLGISIASTGCMFLLLMVGILIVGPLFSYLTDSYNRKYLCVFSFAIVVAVTAAYTIVNRPVEMLLFCFIQGIAFGIASSSVITLGIDLNVSSNRSKGNVVFGWFTRLGMITGVALGSALYLNYGFETLISTSIIIGVAGILAVFITYVPFRAPIGTNLFALDRFFLPRTWVFALNLILVAFVPGILFPLIHFKICDTFLLDEWTVPYFMIAGIGFLLSIVLVKLLFRGVNVWLQVVIGLTAITGAVCALILFITVPGQLTSAILLGIGIGIITPVFLLMFVNLSRHCQRGTANITHLLSWEIGISLGVAASCYLKVYASSNIVYQTAMYVAALSVVFFIIVAYPYYQKKKVR